MPEAGSTSDGITIARIGARGDGVADTPGGPVHVPFALPGERWRLTDGASPVRLSDAPGRRPPPCRHFGVCGGCAAQHMPEDVYRRWKHGLVDDAFQHRGLSPAISPLRTFEAGARRRAAFSAVRAARGVVLGYNERGSHAVVDLAECPVLDPAIVASLGGLREIAELVTPSNSVVSTRMTATRTDTGLDIAVEGGRDNLPAEARAALARVLERSGFARLTVNGETTVQQRQPELRVAGVTVAPPPGAFVQAEPAAQASIVELVTAATKRAKRVADLFCGLGTLTFPLARRSRVLAVDGDPALIDALAAATRRTQGLKPVETKVRDLFREPLSPLELEPFDAVVFDPPRAGASMQAERIARSRVPVVVAVSCNPATLARDARTLVNGGYQIDSVTPIDQFIYSAQVEVVAVLRLGSRVLARRAGQPSPP